MTAVITFMRCNPPTIGHFLIVDQIHEIDADAKFVYLSHSQDPKKNPLDYNTKYAFMKAFVDEKYGDVEVVNSPARTIIEVLTEVTGKYENLIMVVGSDRVEDFYNMITKYNGKPNKKGDILYSFEDIEVLSAGNRDADSEDNLTSMSATKQRKLAAENNFEEFRKGVPTSDESLAKELFTEVRKGMGM